MQHLGVAARSVVEASVAVLDTKGLREEFGGGVALRHCRDAFFRHGQQVLLVVGRLADQQGATCGVEGLAALAR